MKIFIRCVLLRCGHNCKILVKLPGVGSIIFSIVQWSMKHCLHRSNFQIKPFFCWLLLLEFAWPTLKSAWGNLSPLCEIPNIGFLLKWFSHSQNNGSWNLTRHWQFLRSEVKRDSWVKLASMNSHWKCSFGKLEYSLRFLRWNLKFELCLNLQLKLSLVVGNPTHFG